MDDDTGVALFDCLRPGVVVEGGGNAGVVGGRNGGL